MTDQINPDGMLRCTVTGNPCGTDTWEANSSCSCEPCTEYLRIYNEGYKAGEMAGQAFERILKYHEMGS